MKLYGPISELVAAAFRKGGKEVRVEPATQSGSGPVVITIPDVGSNAASLVTTGDSGTVTSTMIANGTIVDGDINASAGIVYSKLNLQPSGLGAIVNNDISLTAAITDTKLATISTAGKVSNSATTATSSNTASAIVARDGSGSFSASTVTATSFSGPLTGNVTGNVSGTAANVTGIVAKANGGTGADNSSVTFPSTGTLATLSGGETLLNKAVSSTAALTGALTLPAGNGTTERSGLTTNGMIRYNTDSNSFEGYAAGDWSNIGGGGTTDRITQATSFAVGDVLYLSGSTYTKAIATSAAAAEVVGVVSKVITAGNVYELTLSGEVTGLSGLTAGEAYFLSESVAGGITITEPSVIGQVSVPIGVASSATTLYVAPKRGNVVGGVNARTQIALTAVTTAQPVYPAPAGIDAGELTGWVYLDATADSKFYVSAKFAKNGAGNDWNIAPSYVGDTPPAGFSMTMNNSGLIQITMNPLPTGFVSGYINYALNAPAVGATFPLAVSGSSVTGGTPLVDTVNENTLNNGVQIKGRTSGVAIPSGYVGEMSGTLRSGTGGFTYSTRSTTAPTTSFSPVISLTLNKGIYFISGIVNVASGVSANVSSYLAIGTTQVSTSTTSSTTPGYNASTPVMAPIVISADSTIVSIYSVIGNVTGLVVNGHELFAIRIA